ncbi:MAG: hypothetical protein JWR60_2682 [Polaromonas sp.]|nr:hypothetical protein [Polaromonas sp.]
MDELNGQHFAKATEILEQAKAQLEAIGMNCMLSPSSLPQGYSVSLHVAQTEVAVIAAHVAAGHGGAFAHAGDHQFASEVADMATDLALERASR